jgi:hypothetical protein
VPVVLYYNEVVRQSGVGELGRPRGAHNAKNVGSNPTPATAVMEQSTPRATTP